MYTAKFETFFKSNLRKTGRVFTLMKNIQAKFLKLIK